MSKATLPKSGADAASGRLSRLDVQAGQATEQGRRERNEDFAAFEIGLPDQLARHGAVAVLADGVGGAKGGREAAEVSVGLFLDGYLSQSPAVGVARAAARSVDAANRWLHTIGRTDPALEGLCCTLTALVLRGRQAHLVHVGDSRLYRLRDGILEQLTTDHVVGPGAGQRHILTRAVGAAGHAQVDYAQEMAQVHDRYVLCSDGVHGVLSDARIRGELARRAAPAEAARRLVAAAAASHGASDNATAVVVDVLDLPPASRADLAAFQGALPILPPPPPPRSGAVVVDGFRLDAMLADGRYSRVFRARDVASGREAVLKFPVPFSGNEGLLRQAFLREGWIAARVRSPYVGEVWELPPGRQTRLYAAMPFYDGETLEQRLRREPRVSLTEGLLVASCLCKAVASLHRAGIIHRDIKPENIVLQRRDGTGTADGGMPTGLRLVDLGVARLPHLDDAPEADAPGTPSYKAPELLHNRSGGGGGVGGGSTGDAAVPGDERSDLYAVGVTLYRMFAGGAYPYGEVEPFSRPRFARPVPLLQHRPDLPAWLDGVLARAVAELPEERQDDAVELAFALEHGATLASAASSGVPGRRRLPLSLRHPLRFWQGISALLAVLLLAALALR